MPNKNSDGTPNGTALRQDGAIPYASQIPNNSVVDGDNVDDAFATVNASLVNAELKRVAITGLSPETITDEQSADIGGVATDEFCPTLAIFHMEDVGAGVAANGDAVVTIGITSGGTEILAVTTLTNLIGINTKFAVDLTGLVKAAIPANSKIYVKVTTADTTAGAAHLVDTYVLGQMFTSGT